MGLGVVIWVRSDEYVTDEQVAAIGAELYERFDLTDEDFVRQGLLTYVPREDFFRAGMEEEPGFLLDLNLCRKYFGYNYDRGDLPLFVGIAEYLEEQLSGARILYGADCLGKCFRSASLSVQH